MNQIHGMARDQIEFSCLDDLIEKENQRHFDLLISHLSSAG